MTSHDAFYHSSLYNSTIRRLTNLNFLKLYSLSDSTVSDLIFSITKHDFLKIYSLSLSSFILNSLKVNFATISISHTLRSTIMTERRSLSQMVFEDLLRVSPIMGFNIKTVRLFKQGELIQAFYCILEILNFKPKLTGELNNTIRFKDLPQTCSIRITGPTPYQTRSIYIYIEKDARLFKEFFIATLDDLIPAAQFVQEQYAQFAITRDASLRALPRREQDLLQALSKPDADSPSYFAEAGRAVARDCLLDAVIDLFTPFGVVPRIKDDEPSPRVIFHAHYLSNHCTPLVWIERLNAFLDLDTNGEVEDGMMVFLNALAGDPPIGPLSPTPISFKECRRRLKTSVIVYIRSFLAPMLIPDDMPRSLHDVLLAANLAIQPEDPEADTRAFVFNLASAEDRITFVKRILLFRQELGEAHGVVDYEKKAKYLGKMKGWDTRGRKLPDAKMASRIRQCNERRTNLSQEVLPEEVVGLAQRIQGLAVGVEEVPKGKQNRKEPSVRLVLLKEKTKLKEAEKKAEQQQKLGAVKGEDEKELEEAKKEFEEAKKELKEAQKQLEAAEKARKEAKKAREQAEKEAEVAKKEDRMAEGGGVELAEQDREGGEWEDVADREDEVETAVVVMSEG